MDSEGVYIARQCTHRSVASVPSKSRHRLEQTISMPFPSSPAN